MAKVSSHYRAILFDLDGTLYQDRPSASDCFYRQASLVGAPIIPERLAQTQRWAHYYWARSAELQQDLDIYPSLSPEFWVNYTRHMLQNWGCSAEHAAAFAPLVAERMDQEFHPEAWVEPETPSMLQALKEAGFLLAVVSNRGRPIHDNLQAIHLDGYFHLALAAGEVNSWKPEPGIFRHVLEHFSLQPEQAIYVGDNYYADIVGAQNAGLRGVLLDPERVFPEADCSVIERLPQLMGLLQ